MARSELREVNEVIAANRKLKSRFAATQVFVAIQKKEALQSELEKLKPLPSQVNTQKKKITDLQSLITTRKDDVEELVKEMSLLEAKLTEAHVVLQDLETVGMDEKDGH